MDLFSVDKVSIYGVESLPQGLKDMPKDTLKEKCAGYVLAVIEIKSNIEVPLYCCDNQESSDVTNLPEVIHSLSTDPVTEKLAGYNSALFYIYTSGTTGRDIYIRWLG